MTLSKIQLLGAMMLLVAAALAGGTNRLLQPVVQAKEASGNEGGPPGQVRTVRNTEGEGSIIKTVTPTQVKGTDLSWGEVVDGLQASVGLWPTRRFTGSTSLCNWWLRSAMSESGHAR